MEPPAPLDFDAFVEDAPPTPPSPKAWYTDPSLKCTVIVAVVSMLACVYGHGSIFGLDVFVIMAFFCGLFGLVLGSVLLGLAQLIPGQAPGFARSNLVAMWKWIGPIVVVLFASLWVGGKAQESRLASAKSWLTDRAAVLDRYQLEHGAYPKTIAGVIDIQDAPALVRGHDFYYHSDGTSFGFQIYTSFDNAWCFSSESRVWEFIP